MCLSELMAAARLAGGEAAAGRDEGRVKVQQFGMLCCSPTQAVPSRAPHGATCGRAGAAAGHGSQLSRPAALINLCYALPYLVRTLC